MGRHDHIQALRDLHQICAIRRADIDMQVERANAQLRRLDEQLGADAREVRRSQEGWREAVSGGSLQLAASAFWSAEVLRAGLAVQETASQIRGGQAARQELCAAQNRAMARCDAVDALLQSARRGLRRQQDELALETCAHRMTGGWGTICE